MGGIMPRTRTNHPTCLLAFSLLVWLCLSPGTESALSTSFSVQEEQGPDSLVGNIVSSTELAQLLEDENPANVEFKILPGAYKQYFNVDNAGELSTGQQKLDRDSLCPAATVCRIEVDVALVKPERHFQFIKVALTIEDINDNSPEFPADDEGKYVLSMSENTAVNTAFVLPTASDADGREFGVQRYTYKVDASIFQFIVTNSSDGTLDLQLVLKARLDREVTDVYTGQIVAHDGGSPARSGTLPLEIRVLDANDNSPTFDNATYVKRVPEDASVSQIVCTVHASDPDDGPNGDVVYSFTTQTANTHGDTFGINDHTGEIYLNGQLDFETQTSYTLQVTARDQGPDGLMAHAKVVLHVLDINDHQPQISVTALTASGRVEVSESASTGTFVAHILVQDPDAGDAGKVNCRLHDSHFKLVELFPSEYKMQTTGAFDRESQDVYRVTIHCSDMGDSPLSSVDEIAVTILDENDHDPVFTRTTYAATLKENNTVGTKLLRVRANDRDIGINSDILYSLHQDARDMVSVDNDGFISTNAVFDHEKKDTFTFRVIASDQGVVRRSATATVTLGIIDVNDEAPRFEHSAYSFGTYENQNPGTEIGVVSATDADNHPYDEFAFSLDPTKSDIDNFRIDPDSGKITTRNVLDREYKSAHYLVVLATDTRYPYPSSSANVSIFVADINDNAPSVHFPVVGNNTVYVSSYAPTGYVFTSARAQDADLGDNGVLVFSIAKGNEDGIFDIDPVNGDISVMHDLDSIDQDWFVLTLLVKDMGQEQKSAVAVLNVQVNRTKSFATRSGMFNMGARSGGSGRGGSEEDDGGGEGTSLSYHKKIIIILAAVTAVIVAILITAIVCIKRRQIKQAKEEYRYMCRVDLAERLRTPSPTAVGATRLASQPDGQTAEQTDSMMRARKAKEVKFNLADGDSLSGRDWPHGGHWTSGDSEGRPSQSGAAPVKPPVRTSSLNAGARHQSLKLPSHLASDKEVEMHQLLNMLKKDGTDTDSTSGCSADGSNTDSGRGASEEGDHHHHHHHHHHIYANHSHQPSRGIPRISEDSETESSKSRPPSYNSALHCEPEITPAHAQSKRQPEGVGSLETGGCQGRQANGQSPCTYSHGSKHHHGNKPCSGKYQPKPAPRISSLNPPDRPARGVPVPLRNFNNKTYLSPSNARTRFDDTSDNTSNGSSTSGSFIVDLGSDTYKAVDV